MPSQRVILGIGLAILLVIGAASIGLDIKSRADIAAVDHTLEILNKISNIRLLVRRAESAARGFALTNDAVFAKDFRDASEAVSPTFADIIDQTHDNPRQRQLLEETRGLVLQRFAVLGELMTLRPPDNRAEIAAFLTKAEERSPAGFIGANFDSAIAEERRLLGVRDGRSDTTGRLLLAIDLAGVVLVLVLAIVLIAEARRSSHMLRAANERLEASVAERTEHLVAAHEALRRSTAVMESTFNSMAEAVLVIDTKGEVQLSNAAAERMLRYKPGMSVDLLRQLSNVFQADGVTPLTSQDLPAARALRGEQFEGTEIIARPRSGREPVHLVISGRPLRDASGAISGAALVYHDISASRDTERRLLQSQKLDAIGKLTGGVAHDFNNMLTVITGTTESLVVALKGQPALLRTAELIDQAAERCRELVQHLLAFARRQPLQPRDVDINATVLDIAKLLRPTLGEQIEISWMLQPEVTTAHVDPSQLAHSLLNLAINARDAMPSGGKLLFETKTVALEQAYAAANPEVKAGSYIMVAVSDTGTGMSQEVQDKVFEPFFTTKEVGKGTGLGMSMVYGFVKQSGGHIKIYSEEGHGTTIRLYLPPARGEVKTGAAAAVAAVTGGTEIVLVVEDDTLVRNFATAQLQSLGYRTVATPDGRGALALIDSGQPFDLLFTDVILPGGMTGRQLADEVIKRRPDIKVLYTSGYTDNAITHHGRLDKGLLLLTKPYRKSQLAKLVRQALKGETA